MAPRKPKPEDTPAEGETPQEPLAQVAERIGGRAGSVLRTAAERRAYARRKAGWPPEKENK